MTEHRGLTPREVFGLKQERMVRLDTHGQAELFAESGVLEIPFAPPGVPNRIVGREAIRAVTSAAVATALRGQREADGHHNEVVHETTDPEVIVAEFTARTRDRVTGETYEAAYIQVLRIRDGQIVLFRDYCPIEALTELWGDPGAAGLRSIADNLPQEAPGVVR